MNATPLVLGIIVGVLLAGCVQTTPVPLSDSRLELTIEPVRPVRAGNVGDFLVHLVNRGPESAKVDPLSFGRHDDTIREIIIQGPNATYEYHPNPVARGPGPFGGADYPECGDLRQLDPGETHSLDVRVDDERVPGLQFEKGQSHQIQFTYATPCLNATWRGNLTGAASFVPE